MQVDDREELAAVWLVGGPGPEAVWPLSLGGRYAEHRREWYFPKGTRADAIFRAAGLDASAANGDNGAGGTSAAGALTADDEHGAESASGSPDGLPDPLADEVDAQADGAEDDSPRVLEVERAVRLWTEQLIDRSARNNLLFFRHLRAGTLDLSRAQQDAVSAVLSGGRRSLRQLLPVDETALEDAARRVRTIRNKARAVFEERGIETLHLAWGLATWDNQRGTAEPAAPVLLAPVHITAHGAAQRDFDITVTGDVEVNPTLLHTLKAEFKVECDPDELLGRADIDGAIDTLEKVEIAYAWLVDRARSVPGFSVRPSTVLGTFLYARLPMVSDLQGSVEALARHDLVAALAGDRDARERVRSRRVAIDAREPDRTPPADEFLVLDADSSQNRAINTVLAGQDLIIEGPPGTGKSQTITNLISCLVARGRSVLFVAEKRAAIDAVLKRLKQVGLDDLVLDLHGGTSSKRKLAQSLDATLKTNAAITAPSLTELHRRLEQRRRELNEWVDVCREPREPWKLSVFEAQCRLLAVRDAETEVRLRGQTIRELTPERLEQLSELVREFVGLGGLRIATTPWAASPISEHEQVDRAVELVDDLAMRTIEPLLDALERASTSIGVQPPDDVRRWDDRLVLWRGIRETLDRFDSEVFSQDLEQLAERLAPLSQGIGSRVSARLRDPEFRAAYRLAKRLRRKGVKLRKADLHAAVRAAAEQRRRWDALEAEGTPRVPDDLDQLEAEHRAVREALTELSELAGAEVADGGRPEVVARLRSLRETSGQLGLLPELHRLRTELAAAGLGELIADLGQRAHDVDIAVDTLEFCLMASIIDDIRLRDSRVAGFDGERHTSTVEQFQEADREHIGTTAQRVRRLAAERARRVGDEHPEQAALVTREAAKKTRHRPLREMFRVTPEVMTAVKPCWAMSPLIVSQVLPNDAPCFDVVIFDEASQVRPAEAIPAIARGRRLVVAGDAKQLPPTDFFSGPVITTDDDEEDGLSLGATSSAFESILDALKVVLGWRRLEWHYRSADERLIAFSNAHLYGKSLLTFPGVTGADCLRYVQVPWHAGRADGEDSSNAEVMKVVELILEHAERHPDQSLGVIAMGIKHAQRIDETLRRTLRDRGDLEEFFSEDGPEPFFVKNLERVQGDERDAIILTVGYGRTSDGGMAYRFGPLNEEGGERRLNVAITRARRRMTVVSSFSSADMDPERTRRGGELLRLFLAYAESPGDRLDHRAGEGPQLNPFELDVRDALQAAGIPVICQWGVGRYRLDFAAKHPERPGQLVLAIEADGASYHSSVTARDRDRLRQEHLERLGWRFHRIWSQDWFANREREIEKARAAYRAAVDAADRQAAAGSGSTARVRRAVPPVRPMQVPAGGRPRGPRPNLSPRGSIDAFTDRELQVMVRWIESDTLLRSRDDLIRAVMQELGFARRGSKIVRRIGAAIDAVRAGTPARF